MCRWCFLFSHFHQRHLDVLTLIIDSRWWCLREVCKTQDLPLRGPGPWSRQWVGVFGKVEPFPPSLMTLIFFSPHCPSSHLLVLPFLHFKCPVQWHQIHTLLCNHHHHPSPELLHLPKQTASSHFPLPQALAATVLPAVYEFGCSRCIAFFST